MMTIILITMIIIITPPCVQASAAGAFLELANGTSSMEDATVDDASSFAGGGYTCTLSHPHP